MAALLYKKLYTPLKETLEDDYSDLNPELIDSSTNNVGLKMINVLKTQNGLKLKSTHQRDPNTNYTTTFEPEIKLSQYNFLYEGKIGTDKKFQHTFSFTDMLLKGSKLYAKVISEKKGKRSGELGFEYKDSNVSLNGSFNQPNGGNFKVFGAGVLKYNTFLIGGDIEYENEVGITRYSAKLQKECDESTCCLFANDQLVPKKGGEPKKEVGFGYYHKVRDDLKGAVDFKVDNNLNTEVRVGSDYKLDETSNLKSRMFLKQQELRVGIVYKHKVTPNSKVIVGTDLNARSLFGTPENVPHNDHRFNFTFSFGED